MVCQNTLFADEYLEFYRRPNSSKSVLWTFLLPDLLLFCVLEYWNCKSDEDLLCSKALKSSFFVWIASLASWFHQGVLFSWIHYPPPFLAAFFDNFQELMKSLLFGTTTIHFISLSSETSGSSRNFVAMLDANYFLTSLSARASHFIL